MTWLNNAEVTTAEDKAAQAKEAQRQALKAERDRLLSDSEYTLSDGSVFQVRPVDQSLIQTAIQLGQPIEWILKDNTVRLTTTEELQEVLSAGTAQAQAIWNNYSTALKAMQE